MVQHQISHQGAPHAQGLKRIPVTQVSLELFMTGNSKSPIARGLQKGEHVHNACQGMEVLVEKCSQRHQGRFIRALNRVAIGDQHACGLIPAMVMGCWLCGCLRKLKQRRHQRSDLLPIVEGSPTLQQFSKLLLPLSPHRIAPSRSGPRVRGEASSMLLH